MLNTDNSWHESLKNRITSLPGLIEALKEYDTGITGTYSPAKELELWLAENPEGRRFCLPFAVTRYYLGLAFRAGLQEADRLAVLRQAIPSAKEYSFTPDELKDPLGENKYSPCSRFIHRYPDRALILTADSCGVFCRHCFRRGFSGQLSGALKPGELSEICSYIEEHPEINEILLSGGDPLTLSDSRILEIVRSIKDVRSDIVIRICSRMPVVLPSRITPEFTAMLSEFSGIWMVTHFNTSPEVSAEAAAAVKEMIKAGVPVLNQTVLLRGVNDSSEQLARLFRALLSAGVKPYYLFQGDLARGTSHLRVPLEKSLEIAAELRTMVSGMAMPKFAVDLPGGGGKVTLPDGCEIIRKENNYYYFRGTDDREYSYPAD